MRHYAQPSEPFTINRPRFKWSRLLRSTARFFLWLIGGLVVLLFVYLVALYPWMSHWGATSDEIERALPGDDLVPQPITVTTKAVAINAPPERVWPWLVQLGVDRGGMYSYLWVENWMLRLNVENTHEIRPEWQHLEAGDFIRFTPVDYPLNPGPGLYVFVVEPPHTLVGCFGLEQSQPSCAQAATWQFIIEADGQNNSRLLLRSRTAGSPTIATQTAARIAYFFQFIMERKMLIELKERAENLPLP